jgi:primase-polymerase (primpol)-like protein
MPLLSRADAQFCSTRCRVAAHRKREHDDPVPTELVRLHRWVRYDRNKVPMTTAGIPASSTNAATWATYRAASRSPVGVGVGFVLNGDGIVCLDLDGCIAPSGVVTPPTLELLRLAGRTYAEVSPSGQGLHIWGRTADLPHGRKMSFHGQPVELYPSGRYMTVTGRPFRSAPSQLGDISEAVAAVLA